MNHGFSYCCQAFASQVALFEDRMSQLAGGVVDDCDEKTTSTSWRRANWWLARVRNQGLDQENEFSPIHLMGGAAPGAV
jgi:hypothetical protein